MLMWSFVELQLQMPVPIFIIGRILKKSEKIVRFSVLWPKFGLVLDLVTMIGKTLIKFFFNSVQYE
jgi:hypothetical protein